MHIWGIEQAVAWDSKTNTPCNSKTDAVAYLTDMHLSHQSVVQCEVLPFSQSLTELLLKSLSLHCCLCCSQWLWSKQAFYPLIPSETRDLLSFDEWKYVTICQPWSSMRTSCGTLNCEKLSKGPTRQDCDPLMASNITNWNVKNKQERFH